MKKLLLVLFCLVSFHATAAVPKADDPRLAEIESYLNGLRKLSASVLQVGPDGSIMTGELKLQRPGKMRLTYTPPSQSFIVADGTFVHYWDDEMKQTSSVPLSDSLAALILRDTVKFGDDLIITDLTEDGGVSEISFVKKSEPEAGQLTLVFSRPLALKQWRVLDSQGAITRVSLQDINMNPEFKDSVFNYTAPNFGQNPKVRE